MNIVAHRLIQSIARPRKPVAFTSSRITILCFKTNQHTYHALLQNHSHIFTLHFTTWRIPTGREQSNQMKIKSRTARTRRLNINYSVIRYGTELMIAKHGEGCLVLTIVFICTDYCYVWIAWRIHFGLKTVFKYIFCFSFTVNSSFVKSSVSRICIK